MGTLFLLHLSATAHTRTAAYVSESTLASVELSCRIQSAIMRIGFFGGSFDPPHLGHLAVGHAAAEAFSLDRILFTPTGRQPLKTNGASASFADRLIMVSLLCELQPPGTRPYFEPSSSDAPHADGSPNYTVDALSKLRGNYSTDDNLFVIVGADAFLDLPRWRSPDILLQLAEWIVVSRPGVSLQQLQSVNLTPGQLSRVHLLEDVHEPASATDIRELLSIGSDCFGLLPSSILNYIRAHHLYGT
jgi:nicotinate-nucleotide adenylyltransferase